MVLYKLQVIIPFSEVWKTRKSFLAFQTEGERFLQPEKDLGENELVFASPFVGYIDYSSTSYHQSTSTIDQGCTHTTGFGERTTLVVHDGYFVGIFTFDFESNSNFFIICFIRCTRIVVRIQNYNCGFRFVIASRSYSFYQNV